MHLWVDIAMVSRPIDFCYLSRLNWFSGIVSNYHVDILRFDRK